MTRATGSRSRDEGVLEGRGPLLPCDDPRQRRQRGRTPSGLVNDLDDDLVLLWCIAEDPGVGELGL